jgi:hypothetical protein
MSVQEIWFNASATATPDETTWIKFTLDTPKTVDLASSTGGVVTALTDSLNVPIGTYEAVRLIPVDGATTLLSSAPAGVTYNSEVDYTDSNGTPRELPMELLNPDKGIGVAVSIKVNGGGVNILSSTTDSTSTNGSSSSSTSTKPFLMAINVDGARDLVPFEYDSVNVTPAVLLNPHMTGYDTSTVGAIQGTINTANLGDIANSSTGLPNIQVTAESLSADGSRHTVVNSAQVRSDGSFTVYPLSTSSSSPTNYDLVIHGPSIASVIVKDVPVTAGDPTSTTPVNIGTITPRSASSFNVTLLTTNATAGVLPAGSMVNFYQTVPGNAEVPYVVEQRSIDPFTRAFPTNWEVDIPSSASIDFGTYSSGSVSLENRNPAEGAGTYRVAATAPLYSDGVLTTLMNASTPMPIAVPTLLPASGFSSVGTTIQVSKSTKYDHGDLIISHDGAVVGTAVLDTALQQNGASVLAFNDLPARTDSALYYVSVRVWNSADPAGTLKREIYPSALDLRTLSSVRYGLNID